MKKQIFLYIVTALFVLTGCDRSESHVSLPGGADHNGGAVIGLDITGIESARFADTHLYGFDASQKMVYHKYYPTQQEFSSDFLQLESGIYTFVVVMNVGEHFANGTSSAAAISNATTQLPEMSLSTLFTHIKAARENHSDMLTGLTKKTITVDKIARITISVKQGIGGITSSNQTLTFVLPGAEYPEYQLERTRATAMYNLRGVVEFYQNGQSKCLDQQCAVLTPTAVTGQYTMDVQVPEGVYDLLTWVDYTAMNSSKDLYYNTASLRETKIITTDKQYAAGGDSREMFYAKAPASIGLTNQSLYLVLERPAAKYRLIADDVRRYKSLAVTNPENYPPLTELNVNILYEGYLPDGFNVSEAKPNSSEMGYKYKAALPVIGDTDREVQIGCDYVLVNGEESSVSVTVEITDKTGRKISRVQGVEIDYKRGMVTTIKGQFLTSGVVNPGINISTDWDGIYDVNF